MLEKVYVKDLLADTFIDSPFLLDALQVKQKKNGENFLSLVLKDKTGDVGAVMWDGVDAVRNQIANGDYVLITGKVSSYNDRTQVTVQRLKKLTPEQVDDADYIPATERDVASMWKSLVEIVNSIGHLHLRKLLLDIVEDEEIAEKMRRAPAAKGNHHTYIGGLLEHTLSIVGLCEKVADHYDFIDRDLLVTGGILHDLGKIDELMYERNFDYSEEGRLLGHIVMEAADLDRRMRNHDFPDKLRIRVLHMIISHHGELEFGSPKVPMTPEAMALHYIDMIDSRLEMMRAALDNERDMEGAFTSYHRALGRQFYKV